MTRRLDARDVLDADATTARGFSGRVLGVYRRTGPNPWDDYVLVEEDGGPVEVFADTPVLVVGLADAPRGDSEGSELHADLEHLGQPIGR